MPPHRVEDPTPANDDRKPAIVTTTSRKRTKLLRAEQAAEPDDDPEADAAMRHGSNARNGALGQHDGGEAMPDLARVSRLLADAYRLLSDQSLGRGELAAATAIGEARGKIAVAMKLLAETEERPG